MKRKDCKYTHIGATCDAATNVLTKTLAADQPADCPPTKTKTVKRCPDMEKLAKRGNKKGNKRVLGEFFLQAYYLSDNQKEYRDRFKEI